MNRCKLCNNLISDSKYCDGKKYCSPYCRHKDWILHNKSKNAEHQKKYRLKTPIICKFCKNKIPTEIRKSGLVFCSENCRKNQTKIVNHNRNHKKSIDFREYKKKIGCQICGYNKNGACLDYHHTDKNTKERRIDSGLWYYKTELFKKEVSKCILVCKNCHYEIHNQ